MSPVRKKRNNIQSKTIIINDFEIKANAYYTVTKLSESFCISTETIRQLIKRQQFEAFKLGRCYLVSGQSVINEIKRRQASRGKSPKKINRFSRPKNPILPPTK